MRRILVPVEVSNLADDEVMVTMSTAALARDGHILEPLGCVADNYRRNNIWLWSHDTDIPTGNGEDLVIGADGLRCKVKFAPRGISARADEYNGLVKAGVVKAVSIGFEPIEMEPLDPKRPRGGQHITKWELLEASWVSVPSDVTAGVTQRAHGDSEMADWKVGASRSLPVEDSDSWDGGEAESSVFDWAGGDDFDAAKARKAFLVYDADKPKERGSYKLPIAHVVDGELKVPKGAIRAAASRLSQTDVPDDVKERAQGVLDHYKKEAGMDDGERGARRPMKRVKIGTNAVRSGPVSFKRGLYQVAGLAYMLQELGYQLDMAKWEAECEGDQSKVPAMLAAVLQDLGDALLAMTAEEVAELLAGHGLEAEEDDADEVLVVEERTHIRAAKTPGVRAFRRGFAHAKLRAGKTLSDETVRCIREAMGHHEDAMDLHRSAIKAHKKGLDAMNDLMDRAGVSDPESDATQTVQNSEDVDVSEGSENGRASLDFRKRQADLLALAAVD